LLLKPSLKFTRLPNWNSLPIVTLGIG